jgi:hypothetical protein
MAKAFEKWLGIAAPGGWGDLLVRTVMTVLAAFLALVLKEYLDTREWDVAACAIDAAWVAGGTFVLNAILMWRAPRKP